MEIIGRSPTLQKLEESYGKFKPPLSLEDQLALLFAYRRALTQILILLETIEKKEEHNSKLDTMLQEWIIRQTQPKKDRLLFKQKSP